MQSNFKADKPMAQPNLRNCYACLGQTWESIPIIDPTEERNTGDELQNTHRGNIIVKHFWFELADMIDGYLCLRCWSAIEAFHRFYSEIEAIHKQQTCFTMVQVKQEKDAVEQLEVNLSPEDYDTFAPEQHKIEAPSDDENDDDAELSADETEPEDIKATANAKRAKKLTERLSESDSVIAQYCKMQCEECLQVFPNMTKLQSHSRVEHQRKAYIYCCDLKFCNRSRLFDHVQLHINPDQFKCEHCNRSCYSKDGLKRHMRVVHTSEENRMHKCERCSKTLTSASDLSRHLRYHEAMETKEFKCDQCEKFFGNSSLLKKHIKNRHTSTFDFVCDTCAKGFNSKVAFQRHVRDHTEKIAVKAQCPICLQWMLKSTLVKHKLVHNTTDTCCSQCGKDFPNKRSLLVHKHSVHREAKYACTICDKVFKRPVMLKEHLASHSGAPLYSCPYCPKTFNSNANMYSHRKKMHPLEWSESKMRQAAEREDVTKD